RKHEAVVADGEHEIHPPNQRQKMLGIAKPAPLADSMTVLLSVGVAAADAEGVGPRLVHGLAKGLGFGFVLLGMKRDDDHPGAELFRQRRDGARHLSPVEIAGSGLSAVLAGATAHDWCWRGFRGAWRCSSRFHRGC